MSKVRDISHKVLLNKEEERRKDLILEYYALNSVAELFRSYLKDDYKEIKQQIESNSGR